VPTQRTGLTVYMHGLPGTAAELRLCSNGGWMQGSQLFVPDRHRLAGQGGAAEHFARLSDIIAEQSGGASIHLVGFSLGAAAALRVAARLKGAVHRIDLIAPAAPLTLGDFLGAMAGGGLFGMARDHPRRFRLACSLQGVLARVAPAVLVRTLLAGSRGADRQLASRAEFRALLTALLAETFAAGAVPYRTEIAAYVAQWEPVLAAVTQPVTIWQGDQDNWVPPAMALALAERLSCADEVRMLPGLSHYSTLAWYLDRFRPGDSPP